MRFLSIAVFAVSSLCCQSAAPQASSPVATEQKRTDNTAANGPVGAARAAPVAPSPAASSSKTVAERKAETMDAVKKRQLVPAGHGSPAQFQ
jgi:hypothetical protein